MSAKARMSLPHSWHREESGYSIQDQGLHYDRESCKIMEDRRTYMLAARYTRKQKDVPCICFFEVWLPFLLTVMQILLHISIFTTVNDICQFASDLPSYFPIDRKWFSICKRLHFWGICSSLHRNKMGNYFFLQKHSPVLALFLAM